AELAPLAARLRAALRSRPEVRVPCHNDLLAANLLDQGSRVWIIDYEYSGNNEPAFELGNLAQENHLSNADLIALTELYYGRRDDRLIARTRLWQMASALVWTVWGVISAQANDLDIDVDFQAWAQEKFGRARSALTAPGFADLLAAGAGS
ncbi:MAG: phosphotransferase, partial [Nostocoides sp.]